MGKDDYHVIPLNDLREHVSEPACWYHTTQNDEKPNVRVRHALDRRELYETGKLLLS